MQREKLYNLHGKTYLGVTSRHGTPRYRIGNNIIPKMNIYKVYKTFTV